MYQIMRENYFWFEMKDHCKRYVVNCSVCRRSKAYNDKKQGLLNPLPIPNRKWMDVSLDFVEFLPECRRRNRVYQHILVIVDRLTKRRLYEPLTSLSTDELMDAMSRILFSSYGFPISTVNDRGSQLTAHLWKIVCERYGVRIKFSSAHHPETDGQTENANKVMKNYLRAYVNYTQDNWVDYLSDAEFAANNHVNVSTGMTPFFADHGFHPRCGIEPPGTYEGKGKVEILHADKIIERQEAMRTWLRDQLAWAQEEQTRHANKRPSTSPRIQNRDMVYVNAKHFASERPSRSLSFKNTGPWKIIRIIDNKAYELEIPDQLKNVGLTPIFHPWKLHLAPSNPLPGQVLSPGPPIAILARGGSCIGRTPPNKALSDEQELAICDYIRMLDQAEQSARFSNGSWSCQLSTSRSPFRRLHSPPIVSNPWTKSFLNRNPQFSKRKQKPLAAERKHAHNAKDIREYFEAYRAAREARGIVDEDVWNMDETGFRIGCGRDHWVVSGHSRNLLLTDPDNREYVTSCECISAGGRDIPTMVIIAGVLSLEK